MMHQVPQTHAAETEFQMSYGGTAFCDSSGKMHANCGDQVKGWAQALGPAGGATFIVDDHHTKLHHHYTYAPYDLIETPTEFHIIMDVPGAVNIESHITLHTFYIKGEKLCEFDEKKGDVFISSQRSFGKFHRHFKIPDNTKLDEYQSKYTDGVLSIQFKKLVPTVSNRRVLKIET
jgi:HSP20 family molecular chaperone IbpA